MDEITIKEQEYAEIIDYIIAIHVSIKEDLKLYSSNSKVLVIRSKIGLPFVSSSKDSIDYFTIIDYKFDWEYRKINGRYMLLDDSFYELGLDDDESDFENIPDNLYNTVAFDGVYEFLTLKEIDKENEPVFRILEREVPGVKKRVLQFEKEEQYY